MHFRPSRLFVIPVCLTWIAGGGEIARMGFAGEIEHSIIWIVDGLSVKTLEEIELPHIRALAAEGAYYKHVEGIAPYHPNQGRWIELHNASLPNPVLLAGTLFINDQTEYVHQVFQEAKRPTAHSTNSGYFSLNDGFTYSYVDDTAAGTDEDALFWAREFFKRGKPAYMRIHMQDLGRAARASYNSKGDPAWADNIWVKGSPFRRTAVTADQQVGSFVEFLKQSGVWDKTVIFLTADHGISHVGRHPYWDPEAAEMPLIILGPGVKKGATFDYADSIDIVPTLCHLAGVAAPATSQGVILSEALIHPPSTRKRDITIREINDLIYRYDDLLPRLQVAATKHPPVRGHVEVLDNTYYGLRRFGEWSDFQTAREVYEHNSKIYRQLTEFAKELGVR